MARSHKFVIARSSCDAAIQRFLSLHWSASRSLSSGARISRDPMAGNDDEALAPRQPEMQRVGWIGERGWARIRLSIKALEFPRCLSVQLR
jgi:hypothetical protein